AILAAATAVLNGVDPRGAFTSAGGTGDLFTSTVPSGGALATDSVKAIVFDPRLTALAILGRAHTGTVAAALDSTRPFPAPVLAGSVVDPGVAGSLAILFPPGSGTIPQITLQRKRGSQLVTIGIAASAVPGVEGARLVDIKGRDQVTGPQIGYG